MNKESLHNQRTRRMRNKPSLVGLMNVYLSTREVILRDELTGQTRAIIDNLYYKDREIIIDEYKCTNNKGNREHSIEQLKKAKTILSEKIPLVFVTIRTRYVYGDYKVEEVYL